MSDILLFEKHFREMETNMEVSFEIILNFNFSGFHQVVKKATRRVNQTTRDECNFNHCPLLCFLPFGKN